MAILSKVKSFGLSAIFNTYPDSTVTDTGDIVIPLSTSKTYTVAAKLFGKHFLVDKTDSEWYLILGEYNDEKLTYTAKQYIPIELCETVKEWELD